MSSPYSVVRNTIEELRESVTNFDDEITTTSKHDIWSVKKLVALYNYVKPYVQIMKKNKFKEIHYVDLFAGSGLVKINNKIIPGTSLIPIIRIKENLKFDNYILADKNITYVKELKNRILKLLGKNKVSLHITKDKFDTTVKNFFSGNSPSRFEYKKRGYLVVLDPFGMQVSWNNLVRILNSGSVDLFLTYMTWAYKWNSNKEQSENAMTRVYGDESWKNCKTSEDFISLYRRKIEELSTSWKPYRTNVVAVETIGGRDYHFIFVSKSDGGHNSFEWIQERIDAVDKDLLKDAFRGGTLKGSDLDYFVKKQR